MIDLSIIETIISDLCLPLTDKNSQIMSIRTLLKRRGEVLLLPQIMYERCIDWSTKDHLHNLFCCFRDSIITTTYLCNCLLEQHRVDFIVTGRTDKDRLAIMGRDVIVYHHITDITIFKESI